MKSLKLISNLGFFFISENQSNLVEIRESSEMSSSEPSDTNDGKEPETGDSDHQVGPGGDAASTLNGQPCTSTSTCEQEDANAASSDTNVSGIKRINSTKRNYRSSQVVDSSDDSNGPDVNTSNTEVEAEIPVPAVGANSADLPEGANSNDGLSDREEDNNDASNQNDDDELRYVASDSDSSDSSLHLMDEDDAELESSSDSSDCVLEDLEEPTGNKSQEIKLHKSIPI